VFLTPRILAADARLDTLRAKLKDWSGTWHLHDEWCYEWAARPRVVARESALASCLVQSETYQAARFAAAISAAARI
jgi:hypothetical protein